MPVQPLRAFRFLEIAPAWSLVDCLNAKALLMPQECFQSQQEEYALAEICQSPALLSVLMLRFSIYQERW